jgi:hypothetical protein
MTRACKNLHPKYGSVKFTNRTLRNQLHTLIVIYMIKYVYLYKYAIALNPFHALICILSVHHMIRETTPCVLFR